jgi:hypothetical protein
MPGADGPAGSYVPRRRRSKLNATSASRHASKASGSHAIISALDAHTLMSTQALSSEAVRGGIKDILLNHAQLWEALRSKVSGGRTEVA